MKIIMINSSHYISGSGNTFTYNLPTNYRPKNELVGLASMSIYNNTFNVTAQRGNNTITIYWNANTTTTYTLTLSNGYYSCSDLNYALQNFCILNNLYVTNSSGQYVYFLELVQNNALYALEINSYYLPTSAMATTLGYTIPSGATWSFPSVLKTPQISFNSAFGSLLGFSAGTYPSAVLTSNYQITSTQSPVISPINSYIVCCNFINNPLSIPNNALYTLPLTGSLGQLVVSPSSQIVFQSIANNSYNQVIIQLYDQLYNQLVLNDTEITITLAIKDADE